MQQLILSIFLFINSMLFVSAQNNTDAERLINTFITSTKTDAIRASFNLTISSRNAVNSQQISGIFILRGNQFYLEMEEVQVWFDGKTQWAFIKENNEVTITEPSEEELTATNPVSILSAYKKKSTIQFGKGSNEKNHVIELTPTSNNAGFTKGVVQLVKGSGNLYSIYLEQPKGETTQLILHNYQKNVPINLNTFVFDRSKFKGVTVNDLR